MKNKLMKSLIKPVFFNRGHNYEIEIDQSLKSAVIILKNCFDTVTSRDIIRSPRRLYLPPLLLLYYNPYIIYYTMLVIRSSVYYVLTTNTPVGSGQQRE